MRPEPLTYREALECLQNRPHCLSSRFKTQQTRAQYQGAHPDIVRFSRAFVSKFQKLNIPMFPHCIVRSREEQAAVFVQGKSRAKPGKSPHQYGMAVDLVHGTRAWDLPNASWDIVGHVGKEVAHQLGLELVWGGDWRFYDPAHWELKDWRSLVLTVA